MFAFSRVQVPKLWAISEIDVWASPKAPLLFLLYTCTFFAKLTPNSPPVSICPFSPFGDKQYHHTNGTKGISLPPSSFPHSCSCTTPPSQGIHGVVGRHLVVLYNCQRLDPHFTPFFPNMMIGEEIPRTKSMSSFPSIKQGLRFDLLLFAPTPSPSRQALACSNSTRSTTRRASTSVTQLLRFCSSSHALCC